MTSSFLPFSGMSVILKQLLPIPKTETDIIRTVSLLNWAFEFGGSDFLIPQRQIGHQKNGMRNRLTSTGIRKLHLFSMI